MMAWSQCVLRTDKQNTSVGAVDCYFCLERAQLTRHTSDLVNFLSVLIVVVKSSCSQGIIEKAKDKMSIQICKHVFEIAYLDTS